MLLWGRIIHKTDTILPHKKAHVHLCDDVHAVQIKAHACISENTLKELVI